MPLRIAAFALACAASVAACTGAPISAERRAAAADDLNPSGRPYSGPPAIRATFPPSDSSGDPLYCHPEPPGVVCSRQRQ